MYNTFYYKIQNRLNPPIDCSKIKNLSGLSFYNRLILNFEGVDFSGCVLYHCFPKDMKNAIEVNPAKSKRAVTLERASFPHVRLSDINFRGSYLKNANLSNSEANRCVFSEANMQGVNLSKAKALKAKFLGTNLSGANLSGAILRNTDFSGADLSEANLFGVNLTASNLSGADLSGANLSGARLTDQWDNKPISFEGAKYNEDTVLPETLTDEQRSQMVKV